MDHAHRIPRRIRRDRAVHAAVAQGLLEPHDTPAAAFVDLAGIEQNARVSSLNPAVL